MPLLSFDATEAVGPELRTRLGSGLPHRFRVRIVAIPLPWPDRPIVADRWHVIHHDIFADRYEVRGETDGDEATARFPTVEAALRSCFALVDAPLGIAADYYVLQGEQVRFSVFVIRPADGHRDAEPIGGAPSELGDGEVRRWGDSFATEPWLLRLMSEGEELLFRGRSATVVVP